MNDQALLTELDTDPEALGYAAAGWNSAVPVMIGKPSLPVAHSPKYPSGPLRVPYTAQDNVDRGIQVEKYQAVAVLMMDESERPLPLEDVTNEQITKALDRDEWNAFSAGNREFLTMLGSDSPAWGVEMKRLLKPGATLTALAALTQSRATELGLGRVRAGDIKRLKGDTT